MLQFMYVLGLLIHDQGKLLNFLFLFQDWDGQGAGSIISEICGFIVVLSGTILLHTTKDYDRGTPRSA